MLPPGISWPLDWNTIRQNSIANTFGDKVRNKGTSAHQGWDLLAYPGTRCYAIADGEIIYAQPTGKDYGTLIILKFKHRERTLYAAYAHLSMVIVRGGMTVAAGEWIALTGNTGNAVTMTGDDQHLHFEIRTKAITGRGIANHLDPKEIYGFAPLHDTIHDPRSSETLSMGRTGLKMPGFNI